MENLYLISNLSNGFLPIFLDIIMLISIFAGILTIITKNPIVSVLYLILLFSSVSCYLIFIGIRFIGISYLLVYVGAVSILFLFILMLINIRVSELTSDTNNSIPLAILTFLIFFIPISDIMPDRKTIFEQQGFVTNNSLFSSEQLLYVSSDEWINNIFEIPEITSIGNLMYSNYTMWLIITSVILLLAMVGSIVITIKQKY